MASNESAVLVVTNGTLIDGTGAKPRPNGAIVVRGNTTAEVSATAPPPARWTAPFRRWVARRQCLVEE